MSNPLPIIIGKPCAEGRLPLHHPWRRIGVRKQHATRALRYLAMDLNDATDALSHSQREDVVQLDAAANTDAAMRHWDRAALMLLDSPSLTYADLGTMVRLAAGLMRAADPCWLPHSKEQLVAAGVTRSDLAMVALYRAVRRLEAAAEKGGAK